MGCLILPSIEKLILLTVAGEVANTVLGTEMETGRQQTWLAEQQSGRVEQLNGLP